MKAECASQPFGIPHVRSSPSGSQLLLSVAVAATFLVSACASATVEPPSRAESAPAVTVLAAPSARSALPSTALSLRRPSSDSSMDVWLFDIGQGSCVVIDCPDGDRPLIADCGAKGQSVHEENKREDVVASIAEILRGMARPALTVSHGDEDHYALIPDILEPADVEGVWLGGKKSQYTGDFGKWLTAAGRAGVPVSQFGPNYFGPEEQGLQCGSARVNVLSANAARGRTKNGDSIVLAVTYGGVTIILPGDAEGVTESAALANRKKIPSLATTQAIIVGSHHGAGTNGSNGLPDRGASSGWAAEWSPIVTAFSMTPASYGHPTCDVVNTYANEMPRYRKAVTISCGKDSEMEVDARMLSTHNNGHLLFRVNPRSLLIYCEFAGPACTGGLPEGTFP